MVLSVESCVELDQQLSVLIGGHGSRSGKSPGKKGSNGTEACCFPTETSGVWVLEHEVERARLIRTAFREVESVELRGLGKYRVETQ